MLPSPGIRHKTTSMSENTHAWETQPWKLLLRYGRTLRSLNLTDSSGRGFKSTNVWLLRLHELWCKWRTELFFYFSLKDKGFVLDLKYLQLLTFPNIQQWFPRKGSSGTFCHNISCPSAIKSLLQEFHSYRCYSPCRLCYIKSCFRIPSMRHYRAMRSIQALSLC